MARTKRQNLAMRQAARQAILQAALEQFAQQGYAATSMTALAEKAGVSKGLAYHYFPSKAALVAELLEQQSRAFDDLLASIANIPATRRIEAWLERLGPLLIERRLSLRLLQGLVYNPTNDLASVLERQTEHAQRYRRSEARSLAHCFSDQADWNRTSWAVLGLSQEFLAQGDAKALREGLELLKPPRKEA